MHGDEIWTVDPRSLIGDGADGYIVRLPFYFPRHGDPWDDTKNPLDQLRWKLSPGWPEFRLFRGNPGVQFGVEQHFDTMPSGITNVSWSGAEVKHYPYRSPATQRARAQLHERTGFDIDNYRHIIDGDNVFWTDEMIARYQTQDVWKQLTCDR